MTRSEKIRIIIPAVLVVLGLGSLVFDRLLNWRAGKAFERIKQGDAESLVIMYLGTPTHATTCGDRLWWDDQDSGANGGRCVRWASYDYHHSAWGVGYSADAKVVAKHHTVTP